MPMEQLQFRISGFVRRHLLGVVSFFWLVDPLTAAAQTKVASSNTHFFYRIEPRISEKSRGNSQEKKKPSWIFGSIHIGDAKDTPIAEKIYPLPSRVTKAFLESDKLFVEIDVDNPATSAARLPELKRKSVATGESITKGELHQLSRMLGGLGEKVVFNNDVCLNALLLMQQIVSGFQARLLNGVDRYFLGEAKAQGKQILELENSEIQLRALLLDSLSPEYAKTYCVAVMRDILAEKDLRKATLVEFAKVVKMWKQGDDQGIRSLILHDDALNGVSETIQNAVWSELGPRRNIGMASKLIAELQTGHALFIVVGAAHLTGEDSIPALLEKAGYDVRRQ